jgi:branched-chain amino acid transport system substrate-binding protein
MYVTADALSRAKTSSSWTPDSIRDALKATNLQTAFGPVKFEDRDGYQNQNFAETMAIQVLKGEFETIWPKNQASKPYVFPVPTWKERR